ncbi:MAG: hypothetical protein ACM3ML_07885 [Micromonosporaceae bacterium]
MAAVPAQLRELVPEQPAEGLLPVLPVLSGLFPGGGLRRGCIVAVEGSGPSGSAEDRSFCAPGLALLCMTLAAGVSAAGAWCAAVGMPELGVLAAADAGVDLERLLLVPDPGPRWPQVVAALLEGCELVLLCPSTRPSPQMAPRLAAHTRRSGGALVVAEAAHAGGSGPSGVRGSPAGSPVLPRVSALWEGAHVRLRVAHSRWVGVGAGHGRLRGRLAQVVASGRGGIHIRALWCWLPGPDGAVAAADPGDADIGQEFSGEITNSMPLELAQRTAWLAAHRTARLAAAHRTALPTWLAASGQE